MKSRRIIKSKKQDPNFHNLSEFFPDLNPKVPVIATSNVTSHGSKKKTAYVIICTHPNCNSHIVEHQDYPLVELFVSHLRSEHKLIPSVHFVENLTNKIRFIRNIRKYTDPFVYVSREEIISEMREPVSPAVDEAVIELIQKLSISRRRKKESNREGPL